MVGETILNLLLLLIAKVYNKDHMQKLEYNGRSRIGIKRWATIVVQSIALQMVTRQASSAQLYIHTPQKKIHTFLKYGLKKAFDINRQWKTETSDSNQMSMQQLLYPIRQLSIKVEAYYYQRAIRFYEEGTIFDKFQLIHTDNAATRLSITGVCSNETVMLYKMQCCTAMP